MRCRSLGAGLLAVLLVPSLAAAHSPSVTEAAGASAQDALVLEDPTLSRALGATISSPGEVDWYRMDLEAGDPLVVGMTAPDAQGALAATFTVLGPGLPAIPDDDAVVQALADAVGADGALVFEPATEPRREVHGGLGFIDYGSVRTEAPATGSYYVAVAAVDPGSTGKYVFAPGVREEFDVEAIGGMTDLIAFFMAPWPPTPAAGPPASGEE